MRGGGGRTGEPNPCLPYVKESEAIRRALRGFDNLTSIRSIVCFGEAFDPVIGAAG